MIQPESHHPSPLLWIILTIAIVIGVIVTLFEKNPEEQKEEARIRYIQESTAKQQNDAGIECATLKSDLSTFIEQKIAPIINNRRVGEFWGGGLTKETKIALRKFNRDLSLCRKLYATGENGALNGLKGVRFAEEIMHSYITLEIYLKYEGSESCVGKCLDYKFRELKEAYLEVTSGLN